jgi:FkbM family methyltransferase
MTKHFFDVGANVGQTFDDYLCKSGEWDGSHVWCFEPSPRHVPALMTKAQEMAGRFVVHVCPFGLRGGSGIRPFYMKDDPRGDSFESYLASDHLTQNLSPGYTLHGISVGVGDAVRLLTKPGDRVVLKLDCEGSEYSILTALLDDGAALERIDGILVEFHTIQTGEAVFDAAKLRERYAQLGKPLEQWMY